jgi:uncharacterized membrane protein HdeD (DUF308 family)
MLWFAAIGVARIVIGIADRDAPARPVVVVSGVLALLLGLLIALELPEWAAWAIGLIVGVPAGYVGYGDGITLEPVRSALPVAA